MAAVTIVFASLAPLAAFGQALIVADETVYRLDQEPDRLVMHEVGTVPEGTVCIGDQSALGLHAVPREAANLLADVDALVIFAECEIGYPAPGRGDPGALADDWPIEVPAPWVGWDVVPEESALIENTRGSSLLRVHAPGFPPAISLF